MKKIDAHDFFNKKRSVKEYNEIYGDTLDFDSLYPANLKRLEIFIKLLKKYKPKKILDAGCGNGMPLIQIKKIGFDIKGYDKAQNMINQSKSNLKKFDFPTNIIFKDDFENPQQIKKNSVDCIVGMGAFYYTKNFKKTISNQLKGLKKNGKLIFSLRNKLFDLSTLNDYSKNFLDELYNLQSLKPEWKKKYKNLSSGYIKIKNNKNKNIDQNKVLSMRHNPLTINLELEKLGLKVEGIYFYHFHPLPPYFESLDQTYYRRVAWKMEDPLDWRGYLLASCFVVDCKKI